MGLSEKLLQMSDQMTPEERACLKVLLGAAAAELMKPDVLHGSTSGASALTAAVQSVANLQPHRDQVPLNGILYSGRPPFVTDELLCALNRESRSVRHRAVRFHDHLVVSGAPGARATAYSDELGAHVASCAGHVQPTDKANYLYYDAPGMGIEPHVDNLEFSLNVILMLEHEFDSEPSALVVYPPSLPPQKIYLQPGELIVMFADSVVHERERVRVGETIRIVAFGFAPVL